MPQQPPIVVHSHLRWSGVWQRPQQILSRLANERRIIFIEEPVFGDGEPWLEEQHPGNVTVLTPHTPWQEEHLPRISASNQEIIRRLVSDWAASQDLEGATRWHYAPMAVYLRDVIPSGAVVYDCMDELSAFKGAPPELVEKERELMAEADVMFTGGASMYENKRQHHANCHRFDSGVDVQHFSQATDPAYPVPDDARDLPKPVIGYYGVIDERMDYDAIRALAAAFPEGSILMVGPVTKVDPAELPQAPNIHYTGQRSYNDLPGYLKAFSVALVPFADNPATRYLSPTKTLEYFAGRRPVVSSPVKDVVDNYSDVVRIVRTPDEWVAEVRAALTEDNSARLAKALTYAEEKTWDAITAQMSALLQEAETKTAAA